MTEEQETFLSQPNVAVLATVDTKGRPHAVPIWYLYEDGAFIMSTDRASQKHANLAANPEATLVIDKRDVPYYAVIARGPVELGPPISDEQRTAMATRYLGEKLGRAYVERTKGGGSVSLRLRPREVIEYRGRAGRIITA